MNDSLGDYIHFISDSPQVSQGPKTNEALVATLQKKKECEVRAMKTLEFLIEGKIRPQVFLRCINYLNRSYYSDVVEERSITKLCGYCLCGRAIPQMGKQRYMIDSKNKKVYDVTNRKKYCSDYCYKASIHIEKQIDDSPLWLRSNLDYPQYTLLPATDRGIPGDELGSDPLENQPTTPFASAYSFAEVSLGELTEQKPKTSAEAPKINICIKENVPEETATVETVVHAAPRKESKVKKKNKIVVLKGYILEWLTLETYLYLFGEQRVKDCAAELAAAVEQDLPQLLEKLNLSDEQSKAVPAYKQFKKENKDINVKVRSFYSGSSYKLDEKSASSDIVTTGDSPIVIRQNVFLSSVKNSMKVLSENFEISWPLLSRKLEELVKTFALQPHSVVFQPVEWNLISLILIKMLSLHDGKIMEQLNTAKSQKFVETSVSGIPGIRSMLDELFVTIEDVQLFLKRYLHMDN